MNWLGEVREGWHAFLKPIIEACEKENVKIAQVKEKFGALRVYLSGPAPQYIHQYIQYAEWLSERTCEYTGAPGRIRNVDGWLQCVSDEKYEELTRDKRLKRSNLQALG